MSGLEKENKTSSVSIAKERLKSLIVSDRVHLNSDTCELMRTELFSTIQKYMSITEEEFDVKITRSKIYITLTGEEE